MKRSLQKFVMLVLVALGGGLAAASVVAGQGDPPPSPPSADAAPPDPRPAGPTGLAARTRGPHGQELGVATYRGRGGRVCLVAGRLQPDGQLRETKVPEFARGELGNCTFRPNPVAVVATHYTDDPSTSANEAMLTVVGMADGKVKDVELAIDGRAVDQTTPGRDGAFLFAAAPGGQGLQLKVQADGGGERTMELPMPLDPEKIAEGAARNAPDRDAGQHHPAGQVHNHEHG